MRSCCATRGTSLFLTSVFTDNRSCGRRASCSSARVGSAPPPPPVSPRRAAGPRGAGGLCPPAALYPAAAGVGTLGLVDFDVVDRSNLQRQILHGTSGIGMAKTESARARLHDINPHVRVETFAEQLTSANALTLLGRFNVVVDGSDNFPTRYLVNDACVLLGKPNVYGAVFRFDGQVSVFAARTGPCYRCLYAEPPPPDLVPSCAEGGVLGVVPGIIGSLQALEAIKHIVGFGESLAGRLLLFDGRMRAADGTRRVLRERELA